VAALAFPLAALAGGAPGARAEPAAPPPPKSSQEIEVFRGGERSVVRGTLHDDSLREERGVLGTRGVQAGAPARAPDGLATLGGPARERLRADLEAISRVYGELFELDAAPDFAAQLGSLEPGEPLRRPHRHAPSRSLLTPGAQLAVRTRHETSHAWLHALAPEAPAWLHEGLACYLESLERGPAGEIRVRANPRRHDALRSAGRAGQLPSFAKLSKLTPAALAEDPAAAASWALAFSLMQTPEAREVVFELLHGADLRSVASRLTALGVDDPGALPRTWRRTASGAVASHVIIAAEPPPPPESEVFPEDVEEPEPFYPETLDCVRGAIGTGASARPVLFCTER
jgi:hypothetical protein